MSSLKGMFDYYFKGEIKSPWLAGGKSDNHRKTRLAGKEG